jgi:hypothetical protein
VDVVFRGRVIEWRGPAPYFFVPVPQEESGDIREVAAMASYGWGVVPVDARVGGSDSGRPSFPGTAGICCRSSRPCAARRVWRPVTTWPWR